MLGRQIGRGGEGSVFEIDGDAESVAKIYHEAPDADRADKLRWMSSLDDPQLRKVSAWIGDVLLDRPDGDVVGFIMPRVGAKEIHELYSLKSRRVHFPQATWQFLVHTATNVARAFHNLHRNGHVMGDVNHGNCVVLPDGTVKLIDCDSYSVLREDRRYRCEIGVATHLAPELQGLDLGETERLPQHDNFGLAVIIFQLLFLGRHPFSGMFLGDEDKSLEDCIRERRFAYAENAELLSVKQPPGTLSLSALTPRLAAMFERAFLTDDRPEPREWIEALDDLSGSLTQCALLGGHFHVDELDKCPWCHLESETGLILFPIFDASGNDDFNIFTIENLLNDIRLRTETPAWPKPPEGGFHQSQKALDISLQQRAWAKNSLIIFSIVILTASLFLNVFLSSLFLPLLLSISVAIIMIRHFRGLFADERMEFSVEEETARRKLGLIRNAWMELEHGKTAPKNLGRLESLAEEYKRLQLGLLDKARLLKLRSAQYQQELHLSNFRVADAAVFDPVERAALESIGIVSAADIATAKNAVLDKISPELSRKLGEWKLEIESSLPDQTAEFPAVDLMRLQGETALRRKSLERDIETLVFDIRRETAMSGNRQKQLANDANVYLTRLSQAIVDLKASKIPSYFTASTIILGLFIPITVGVATASIKDANAKSFKARNLATGAANGVYGNSATNRAASDRVGLIRNNASYEFSDREISEMTPDRRRLLSGDLMELAASEIKSRSDYKAAVKYLETALRLTPQNTGVMTELADAYYILDRNEESIYLITRANAIDGRADSRAYTLGRNRFALGHYNDAKKEFKKILEREPNRPDVQLYLGRTYRELGEYHAAVKALKESIADNSESGIALFHLVWCLDRIGSRAEAMTYADRLKVIDRDRWQKLKSEIDID